MSHTSDVITHQDVPIHTETFLEPHLDIDTRRIRDYRMRYVICALQ